MTEKYFALFDVIAVYYLTFVAYYSCKTYT